jgi:peptidoglycan/xylan/chitin deacetylase (PgdA/CDA1 family)
MKPSAYGPFPYVPLPRRPRIAWPGEARLAVWIILNLEVFPLDRPVPRGHGGTPDVVAWSKRDYGNRVGFWRLLKVFEKHGFPVTANTNADLCDAHPEIIEAAKAAGWEFMAHGETNTRPMHRIDPAEERAVIRRSLDRIEAATGARPVGWMGPGMHETWNTLDYLAEEKLLYCADWINDDQPYLMEVGGHTLVSMPYGEHPHDNGAINRMHYSPAEFEQMIRDAFDVLYEEGAETGMVLPIGLHPFVAGPAYRIRAVDRALAYIDGHDGVWKATGREIAEHYLRSGATF